MHQHRYHTTALSQTSHALALTKLPDMPTPRTKLKRDWFSSHRANLCPCKPLSRHTVKQKARQFTSADTYNIPSPQRQRTAHKHTQFHLQTHTQLSACPQCLTTLWHATPPRGPNALRQTGQQITWVEHCAAAVQCIHQQASPHTPMKRRTLQSLGRMHEAISQPVLALLMHAQPLTDLTVCTAEAPT